MSCAEVAHRAWRAAAIRAERWVGPAAVPAPVIRAEPNPWIRVPQGIAQGIAQEIDLSTYREAAARIAAGRLDVFAMRGVELGTPPRWNRDPKSGIDTALVFGKSLDYRDPALVGDIKYLWEPNRHLQLVTLAQACALGEPSAFDALRDQLTSWFDACPYPLGPNWTSSLEAGLRLINWSLAWQLIGGVHSSRFADEPGERLRRRWLESVYRHAEFIRGHLSLYSSANNHLLGEAAGLFIAGIAWPHWSKSREWRSKGEQLLRRHGMLQNGPDGVNREQAVSYQQFSFDLLLLPCLAARANGVDFPRPLLERMEKMLEYLASIMDAGGHLPMFGDADDALVVRLSQEAGFCRYRALLAAGAVLFKRADFKAKAGVLDDKTRWLLGSEAERQFARLDASKTLLPVRRDFPEGGYYILGCEFETAEEVRLVADAGPLGYESIAAHGHADALSFTLSLGGCEYLIDPGTYAYHTQDRWRSYFRGTSAHNTVRVDGLDQSVPGGNFMWLSHAHAACGLWCSTADRDVLEAWHDGYTRLADPVIHRRRISLDKTWRVIDIEDALHMSGEHDIELFFHCSEQCSVAPAGAGYRIARGGRSIVIDLPELPHCGSRLCRGASAPILGWVSRGYDDKQPAWTIAWRARLRGAQVLRTRIAW